jgi:hypothetical protein
MDETQGYTATFKSQITGKSVNLRFSIDRGMDSNPFYLLMIIASASVQIWHGKEEKV